MNCSELDALLDGLLDGELDAGTQAAMEEHAMGCESCHAKLSAALQVHDLLAHMDDDVVAPIAAQAGWRSAIRAEAKRRRIKRIYAACGAAAAVCVLTIGVTAALNGRPSGNPEATPRTIAMVQSDSVSQDAGLEDGTMMLGAGAPVAHDGSISYADRTVYTDDAATVRGYLHDIIAEYGGEIDCEAEDSGRTKVYVRIPGENVTDFISAADHLGNGSDAEMLVVDASAEWVGICVIVAQN